MEEKKNLLEGGEYEIRGPENGDIMIDEIELHATNGAKRIWKVKSVSEKELVLEIIKFS